MSDIDCAKLYQALQNPNITSDTLSSWTAIYNKNCQANNVTGPIVIDFDAPRSPPPGPPLPDFTAYTCDQLQSAYTKYTAAGDYRYTSNIKAQWNINRCPGVPIPGIPLGPDPNAKPPPGPPPPDPPANDGPNLTGCDALLKRYTTATNEQDRNAAAQLMYAAKCGNTPQTWVSNCDGLLKAYNDAYDMRDAASAAVVVPKLQSFGCPIPASYVNGQVILPPLPPQKPPVTCGDSSHEMTLVDKLELLPVTAFTHHPILSTVAGGIGGIGAGAAGYILIPELMGSTWIRLPLVGAGAFGGVYVIGLCSTFGLEDLLKLTPLYWLIKYSPIAAASNFFARGKADIEAEIKKNLNCKYKCDDKSGIAKKVCQARSVFGALSLH